MREATKQLIGHYIAWGLVAAGAAVLICGLWGCFSAPTGNPTPTPTPTTTTPAPEPAPSPKEIIVGKPNAGTTASEWMMWLCGAAVPVGVALMLYPPLASVGLPVAAGGAVGSVWNLGMIQHGALIGWIAAGVIVAALVIIAIIAIRRYRALAVASMQGIEAHKAQLSAILADPAHPDEGSLWDRLTTTLSEQYQRAGVDSAAKAALQRLGFSGSK